MSTPALRMPGVWRLHLGRVVPQGVQLAAIVGIAVALVVLSYGMNHMSYVLWGGLWVAPVLLILSLPLAHKAARLDGDAISRIILVAAVIKVIVSPLVRYWTAFGLYGGVADAAGYHNAGAALAPLFRDGIYSDLGRISGTRFIDILTGQLYAFIGPTRLGGFMVFSWCGLLGCYMFFRAFRIAFPDGDGRRYALLVFLFPSMLFWPSSIGKEAFMMLVLGASALGAAHLLGGRFRGFAYLGLGLWGAAIVRPHMALIAGAGLAVGAPIAMLRGADGARRFRGRLGGAVLVLLLLLTASTLIGTAERFFGLDSLNTETAAELLDETTRRTGENGSTFTKVSPNNPVGFAVGTVTVLFRPFPFEVRNAQGVLAGLEGAALFVLCAVSFRRLTRLPLLLFKHPYVAVAATYTFAFIYAFASLVNFGILARERSMLLPFLFVLLCMPRPMEAEAEAEAEESGQRIPESISASR